MRDDIAPLLRTAPCTARPEWLQEWEQAHSRWSAWAVLVRANTDVTGAALLASRWRGPWLEVVALGHGQSDYAELPAVDENSANLLATGLARALRSLPRPWRLRLEQLPADNLVLTRLAALLPTARLRPGDGCPVIDLHADPATTIGLPGGRSARADRTGLRRARNKLTADAVVSELVRTRDPGEVMQLLPEVESLHRARDRQLRRNSDLDDAGALRFWRSVLTAAARRGELEVVMLRLDGRLAAQIVAFLDGAVYRAWEVRTDPAGLRYSAGHLLRAQLVDQLRDEGGWQEFDWMRGVEPYKLTSSTRIVATQSLYAWSSATARGAETAARRLLVHSRRLRERA